MRKELDLSSPPGHRESVDWLRNNVILRNKTGQSVLELSILLRGNEATLYMNPTGGYVMGFQGKDKAYLLDDAHSKRFQEEMTAAYPGKETSILGGLRSIHGYGGLETIMPNGNRVFGTSNFQDIAHLSRYSYQEGRSTYETLRPGLSLLTYMTVECARQSSLEPGFRLIYDGRTTIKASDFPKCYNKALNITRLAAKLFPNHSIYNRVEKLVKRAKEFDELLVAFDGNGIGSGTAKISIAQGNDPGLTLRQKELLSRFNYMLQELPVLEDENGKVLTGEAKAKFLMRTVQNEVAVQAAKEGVPLPDVQAGIAK